MPLSDDARTTVFANRHKPIVGLIHKETKAIVLAPCIPEKVSLELDETGLASSGTFIMDDAIDADALEKVNALLKQGHVPRIACNCTSPFEEISAHQFLFKRKCPATRPSEWGGFTLAVDASNRLEHTFVSGAFNSPPGKRIQGALLSPELINEVKKQTAELGFESKNTEIQEEVFDLSQTGESCSSPLRCVTPPPRRMSFATSPTSHMVQSNARFTFLASAAKAESAIESSPTMGMRK
ncbi:MAG TPA: hypothetical protein DDY37_06540 [Legionella sp.]|nr:hypothetical protein [Legionella sp.]